MSLRKVRSFQAFLREALSSPISLLLHPPHRSSCLLPMEFLSHLVLGQRPQRPCCVPAPLEVALALPKRDNVSTLSPDKWLIAPSGQLLECT